MAAIMLQQPQCKVPTSLLPVYSRAQGGQSGDLDLNMEQLLEAYVLDEGMDLDFLDGTNISDTSKDTAPNNISDLDDLDEMADGVGIDSEGDIVKTGGKSKKRKTSGWSGSGSSIPRKKSHEQMERRRERNRILARRTRLRKKFIFESLQKQVMDLKRQNSRLKSIVKDKMADQASEVLGACTMRLPSIVTESMAEASTVLDRGDFNLIKALQTTQQSFVVTDPSLPDNPIVFASQGFLEMTGYSMSQVLGRNCRFLQGPRTDQATVAQIRKGIAEGADTSVALLNYKVDGTPFWNQFFVAPLRDLNGEVVYFVGAQSKIDRPLEEIEKDAAERARQEAEERNVAGLASGEGEEEEDEEED
ncbi:aureochrome1-like protein [Nannochloropsis gaditana]|uniref:Aureochrome1-like protein n=1 Tax=Nannochloropsis gaditana TaxID=72520 RepID=W7U8A5_9STRA|nr:aureochrome1-like protein [Nannochloropsis gaditana]